MKTREKTQSREAPSVQGTPSPPPPASTPSPSQEPVYQLEKRIRWTWSPAPPPPGAQRETGGGRGKKKLFGTDKGDMNRQVRPHTSRTNYAWYQIRYHTEQGPNRHKLGTTSVRLSTREIRPLEDRTCATVIRCGRSSAVSYRGCSKRSEK